MPVTQWSHQLDSGLAAEIQLIQQKKGRIMRQASRTERQLPLPHLRINDAIRWREPGVGRAADGTYRLFHACTRVRALDSRAGQRRWQQGGREILERLLDRRITTARPRWPPGR